MGILGSYTFQVIAAGTVVLAAASSLVGAVNLHKGQSLVGDALGHASFPGVILAFMLFAVRKPVFLLLGAAASGLAAYLLIQFASRHSKLKLDVNLAVVLSGFFGLGMVLNSHIQGNPQYQQASQAGLGTYIFGQAAYILEEDVRLIVIVAVLCIGLLLTFYKELNVIIFDPEYSSVIGLHTRLINAVILLMTIAVVAVGIKTVGAILISSFLILPCVAANQWSDRFSRVLLLSALFGMISAFVGSYLSTVEGGLSTGPTIIVIASAIALFSLIFAPKGLIRRRYRRRRETLKDLSPTSADNRVRCDFDAEHSSGAMHTDAGARPDKTLSGEAEP